MKSISAIIFSIFFIVSCNNHEIDLSLNLKKGDTYIQKLKIESVVGQDLGSEKLNMEMSTESTLSYTVNAIVDDYYDLDVSYTDLTISMVMPQGKLVFRSKRPLEGDHFSMLLEEMCNKPFKVKLSKSGKVMQVSEIDNIFKSESNQFKDLPMQQLLQIKSQLKKAFGTESFIGNLELSTVIYPDKDIDVGGVWEKNTEIQSIMLVNVQSTYTLTKENQDSYIIKGESNIETKDKDAVVLTDGMPLKYDLSGKMNSELTLDKTTGWVNEAKITQSLKGNAFIPKNPRMPNGMKIPMTIETKYRIAD